MLLCGGMLTILMEWWREDFSEKLTLEKWPKDHAGPVRVSGEEKCWQREQLEPRPWRACRRGRGKRGWVE